MAYEVQEIIILYISPSYHIVQFSGDTDSKTMIPIVLWHLKEGEWFAKICLKQEASNQCINAISNFKVNALRIWTTAMMSMWESNEREHMPQCNSYLRNTKVTT